MFMGFINHLITGGPHLVTLHSHPFFRPPQLGCPLPQPPEPLSAQLRGIRRRNDRSVVVAVGGAAEDGEAVVCQGVFQDFLAVCCCVSPGTRWSNRPKAIPLDFKNCGWFVRNPINTSWKNGVRKTIHSIDPRCEDPSKANGWFFNHGIHHENHGDSDVFMMKSQFFSSVKP